MSLLMLCQRSTKKVHFKIQLLKNAQVFATDTHQIWIQQVQIGLNKFKKVLYIQKQGWPKNLAFQPGLATSSFYVSFYKSQQKLPIDKTLQLVP